MTTDFMLCDSDSVSSKITDNTLRLGGAAALQYECYHRYHLACSMACDRWLSTDDRLSASHADSRQPTVINHHSTSNGSQHCCCNRQHLEAAGYPSRYQTYRDDYTHHHHHQNALLKNQLTNPNKKKHLVNATVTVLKLVDIS